MNELMRTNEWMNEHINNSMNRALKEWFETKQAQIRPFNRSFIIVSFLGVFKEFKLGRLNFFRQCKETC